MTNHINPGTFGKLVIGEAAVKEEAEIVESGVLVFGPLVTGKTDTPIPRTDAEPPLRVKSFDDLQDLVNQKPDAREALMRQELARKPKPWKKAMELFIQLERHRTGGPRSEVLAELEAALA